MRYFLSKYIAPLLWKYAKGSRRYEIFERMKKDQWNSIEENRKVQGDKLFKLLDYSMKNIPYYQRVAREKNISVSRENVFEDIKKFPVLTKEIIRVEFDNLYNKNRKNLIKNHTGGTTGQPLEFFQDLNFKDHAAANKMLFAQWSGLKKGRLTIMLWGSEKDVLERKKGLNDYLFKYFMNNIILNSFNMSESKMDEYVKIIQKNKPELVIAYVQSAAELARYIVKKERRFLRPINVMTSAGTLYDHQREIIEKAFGGQVFNKYGSREASDMACECEKHEGLHVNVLTHFIEILDENLTEVKDNRQGDVYVTCLENSSMPFVRYKIGDRATAKSAVCSCGRGFPIIKHVEGRSMDFLRNANGKFIPAEFFIHFIGVVFNKGYINRFQVIQDTLEKIIIKIILRDKLEFEKYKPEIEKNIRKVFETFLEIEWQTVDKIETSNSGKFRYVVSNIKNAKRQ